MAATTTIQGQQPKLNGAELRNADINYNQYGDDSSAPNQATPGGLNEKYV